MNRLITLVVILILFTFNVRGQNYIPMHLDIGTCWNNISSQQTGPNFTTYLTENTTVIGDTSIGNLHYYIAKTVGNFSNSPNESVSFHYFRNDTMAKKVYAYYSGSDTLLYDFTLGMGDTIRSINLVVDTMGTVFLYGVNRNFFGHKALAWDSLPSMLYFEGIGESRGVARNIVPYIDSTNPIASLYVRTGEVSCAYNGMPLFGDSLYAGNCAPLSTSLYQQSLALEVFPNPAQTYCTIQCKLKSSGKIELFDWTNRLILSQSLTKGDNQLELDLSSFPKGIYFFRVLEETRVTSGKLAIQ